MNTWTKIRSLTCVMLITILLAGLALETRSPKTAQAATQIDIAGPGGSEQFGYAVYSLPNGNFVVTDPYYDAGATADVGAVYLYDGLTGMQISTLTGNTAGDQVGYSGITVLSSGDYVIGSYQWDNGSATNAGAVTWCSGTNGCTGMVTSTNSLVGSTANDKLGSNPITPLSDGDFVVRCPTWDNGAAADAGAVAWCSRTGGCTGVVTSTNSLVGSTTNDYVGAPDITPLSSGDYLVNSRYWNNGPATDAGAVAWCSGTGGCTGVISSTNSLVGSTAGDQVGASIVLNNGNYLVRSHYWDNGPLVDAGAVTWCSRTGGCIGAISSANSLVGGTAGDWVGYTGITPLGDGSYLVRSAYWDNGPAINTGAVTWCSGTSGCTGVISSTNSLVGSIANDEIGGRIMALNNNSYVIGSSQWDNGGTANVGAVTWCSGIGGCVGAISSANSLVGSTDGDQVGNKLTLLSNGNYIVHSPYWDNGALADAGAATWCGGVGGCTGVVTSTNSLAGGSADDQVGYAVTPLQNGSYIVNSYAWDNGALADAGAVTWCSGTGGCTGVVTSTNSLVGSTTNDRVGYEVQPLSNGSYVVNSYAWDNGPLADAGAATWCSGAGGCTGVVTSTNSLVGSTTGDQVSNSIVLGNGNYVVRSSSWDNGGMADAGAVTWCSGTGGCTGTISSTNSLVGSNAGDQIGREGITVLSNNNYVVRSPDWDGSSVTDAGAITWCSGTGGCMGAVSSSNSLAGNTSGDQAISAILTLDNGNYILQSYSWDNGGTTDAGAVTLGAGWAGFPSGAIDISNSVPGATVNGGNGQSYAFDALNDQLIVGRPYDNIVSLFKQPHTSIQSGDWGADDTWDYGKPAARSEAVIDGGAAVTLGADASIRSLTLTQGQVRLGDYNLTVDQTLAVNGAPGVDRMVVTNGSGALRKLIAGTGSFTFPVGDESGVVEYSPATIDFTSGSFAPGASLAVRVVNTRHPSNLADHYLNRYWAITQSGISGFTYDTMLQYLAADVTGDEALIQGMKWDAPIWTYGSLAETANHRVSFTGLGGFSDFTGGSGIQVYPVYLPVVKSPANAG